MSMLIAQANATRAKDDDAGDAPDGADDGGDGGGGGD
jgi:hypothetical protein